MIKWHLPPKLMKAAGVENAFQLSRAAGIGYPTAVRLLDPEQELEKVDVKVLESLARLLGVDNPFDLLKHTKG